MLKQIRHCLKVSCSTPFWYNSCNFLLYHSTASPPVWQQLPADIATRPLLNDDDDRQNNTRRLQKISEKFTDWRCLARYLRYEQHTINEIDEDHRTSAERKYHMLYKWAQRQGDGATPKALLQCVEFELLDRKQAQSIVDAILDL